MHVTVHMRSELIWHASIAIILQSRHDLEVRSWISRMQRLSACAQARCEKQRLKSQHERIRLVASGRWCLAMRRSQQERPAAASMCKEGARARAGTPCVLLTAARASSITRHRAAVLRVMQCEARAARAGEASRACRVVCCCCGSDKLTFSPSHTRKELHRSVTSFVGSLSAPRK